MRLLHTSDWHLGQTFMQFERSYEHQSFLSWLLDTLESESIDGLLIAGDVFDNSNPSAAAQSMLYSFLTEARRRVPHLNIVLTAGNHDSPGRLEAPAPFLSLFDARVVGHVARDEAGVQVEQLVHPLKNREGQVAAWCIAMPFLRPGDVPRVDEADDPYMAGIEALYRQAFEVASEKRENGQTIIAMGHCHMTGSQTSDDSERRIVVGGAEALSASIFDEGIGYVALGHLHLPQKIKGDRRKTETLKLIESKIGLTFDQFTRAVLLAQNDFSTFLKANDDERAELLQTLTGTHTFSEISKQAFVRMRDEKAALDQLREQMANQAPWTLEVRVDKEAKHAQHIEQQKGLDKSKNDTESWLRWYEQLTKQKALDADAGQRVEQATAARVAAKERCVVLARIEEVQPARPLFAEQERLAKEIVTTEKTVNERQRELGLAVKTVEV